MQNEQAMFGKHLAQSVHSAVSMTPSIRFALICAPSMYVLNSMYYGGVKSYASIYSQVWEINSKNNINDTWCAQAVWNDTTMLPPLLLEPRLPCTNKVRIVCI